MTLRQYLQDIVPDVQATGIWSSSESSSLQRIFPSRTEVLLLVHSCSRGVMVVEAATLLFYSIFWSLPELFPVYSPHAILHSPVTAASN